MNVTLPNGAVIEGVPEGTPKDVIMRKAISAGLATANDFGVSEVPAEAVNESQKPVGFDQQKYDMLMQVNPQMAQAYASQQTQQGGGAKFVGGIPGAIPTIASGIIAEPLAGLSGLAAAAIPGGKTGAEQVEATRAALTINPIGDLAKGTLQSVGGALAPIGDAAQSVGDATLSATGSPLAATAVETALIGIPEIIGSRFGAKGGRVVVDSLNNSALPSLQKAVNGFKKADLSKTSKQSIGAAKTPDEMRRAAIAENMPVPFTGDSALTKGQATRNFEQLQFEKEAAKIGESGKPLRDRMESQTSTIISNLDAIGDLSNPVKSELRDIGMAVDDTLKKRHKELKNKERALYAEAEKRGEMLGSTKIDEMPDLFDSLDDMSDTAPNAGAIMKYAVKRGIVKEVDGNIVPEPKTLAEIERFRQFVNDATDISVPREARVRAVVLSAIDDATENLGGDAYKAARKFSSSFRREMENTGLTKKLLANKRGSSERQIAYEDVFKKIMLDSPIEEINKLRATLLKSGPEGKQTWADLKSKGISYIKENSQSASQKDASGQLLFSPDKFNKAIKLMDDKGKLQSIYGIRGAQAIRDLGELATDIYTAPPGAVNFSNTASALQVAMDSLGTFAVTGIPAPVATILKESVKKVKDAKTRKKIQQSLDYLENKEKQSQN